MPSTYEKLDALIIQEVEIYKHLGFGQLLGLSSGKEARRIADATGRKAFRVLEFRLQALKRKGAICFAAGTWRIKHA